jgi:hypothetical protein
MPRQPTAAAAAHKRAEAQEEQEEVQVPMEHLQLAPSYRVVQVLRMEQEVVEVIMEVVEAR